MTAAGQHTAAAAEAIAALLDQTRTLARMREPSRREGWVWASIEELLLAEAGEPVAVDSLPLPSGVEAGESRDCFNNAFRLSQRDPARYHYAEGVAYAGAIATAHAWCVDRESGTIVDPTWAGLTLSQVSPERPAAYLGIRFEHVFHARWVMETHDPAIIDGGWAHAEGRILRDGLVYDERGVAIGWGRPDDGASPAWRVPRI